MEPVAAMTMDSEGSVDADKKPSVDRRFWKDYQFWNVLGVSLAFMILFSAFHTCGMLQTSILSEVHDEYFNGTGKEGYYSAAAIYTVMAAANWVAPSVITYTGPKYGMVFGGIPYCLFMAVFLRPLLGTLYAASVLLGIGAAVLWTSQGVFLTINSSEGTMARNAGIFWAILQLSNLWGNIFATVELTDKDTIDAALRFRLFIGLLCVATIGVCMFVVLRFPGSRDRGRTADDKTTDKSKSSSICLRWAWLAEIASAFRLLKTRNMLLLSMTFAYTGFMLTFYSGVYGTSLHYTQQFGRESNYLLGLSGVLIGLGEIIAGCTFGLLGSYITRKLRVAISIGGIGLQMISYLLIFLFLPYNSPLHTTAEETYIWPSKHLALLCSFLLGFGDAAINTQIYSLLGNMYQADSAPAFALFKFMQSFAAAVGFFYSSVLTLPAQLGIVAGTGIVGAAAFAIVEYLSSKDTGDSPLSFRMQLKKLTGRNGDVEKRYV